MDEDLKQVVQQLERLNYNFEPEIIEQGIDDCLLFEKAGFTGRTKALKQSVTKTKGDNKHQGLLSVKRPLFKSTPINNQIYNIPTILFILGLPIALLGLLLNSTLLFYGGLFCFGTMGFIRLMISTNTEAPVFTAMKVGLQKYLVEVRPEEFKAHVPVEIAKLGIDAKEKGMSLRVWCIATANQLRSGIIANPNQMIDPLLIGYDDSLFLRNEPAYILGVWGEDIEDLDKELGDL